MILEAIARSLVRAFSEKILRVYFTTWPSKLVLSVGDTVHSIVDTSDFNGVPLKPGEHWQRFFYELLV
jgi:hypothetical protein